MNHTCFLALYSNSSSSCPALECCKVDLKVSSFFSTWSLASGWQLIGATILHRSTSSHYYDMGFLQSTAYNGITVLIFSLPVEKAVKNKWWMCQARCSSWLLWMEKHKLLIQARDGCHEWGWRRAANTATSSLSCYRGTTQTLSALIYPSSTLAKQCSIPPKEGFKVISKWTTTDFGHCIMKKRMGMSTHSWYWFLANY